MLRPTNGNLAKAADVEEENRQTKKLKRREIAGEPCMQLAQ